MLRLRIEACPQALNTIYTMIDNLVAFPRATALASFDVSITPRSISIASAATNGSRAGVARRSEPLTRLEFSKLKHGWKRGIPGLPTMPNRLFGVVVFCRFWTVGNSASSIDGHSASHEGPTRSFGLLGTRERAMMLGAKSASVPNPGRDSP